MKHYFKVISFDPFEIEHDGKKRIRASDDNVQGQVLRNCQEAYQTLDESIKGAQGIDATAFRNKLLKEIQRRQLEPLLSKIFYIDAEGLREPGNLGGKNRENGQNRTLRQQAKITCRFGSFGSPVVTTRYSGFENAASCEKIGIRHII